MDSMVMPVPRTDSTPVNRKSILLSPFYISPLWPTGPALPFIRKSIVFPAGLPYPLTVRPLAIRGTMKMAKKKAGISVRTRGKEKRRESQSKIAERPLFTGTIIPYSTADRETRVT